MAAKVLAKKFFNRPTLAVAKAILGKFLVRRYKSKTLSLMITEVEAYDGPRDLASHASRGQTPRTKIMFGEAGHFYVYFTYGMHWLVNIVTGPKGYPAAILLRGGTADGKNINGPARLTKYLKINGKLNGLPANKKTGLWLEDHGINPHTKRGALALARIINKTPRSGVRVKIKPAQIIAGKRIGVDYAGKWAKKPYNFRLKINN